MLKESVAFIAVGQCAGNIVKELDNKGCQCFYINSSLDDLDAVEADLDKRYHINGEQGMAKDRKEAYAVINKNENADKIAEAIYKKYANADIYFFVCSASGGTGGGMTNTIISKVKEFYDEKIIGLITVLPHKEEDMIMQYNAIDFFREVKQNIEDGNITNIQILDNNTLDFEKKLELNTKFADLMNKVLSFDGICKEGNLDEQEMKKTFSSVGVLAIHEVKNHDFVDNLSKYQDESVYYTHGKDVNTHSLILSLDNNTTDGRGLIREVFGVPLETHYTLWDEDTNIIIPSGMSSDFAIASVSKELSESYTTWLEKRNQTNNIKIEKKDMVIDVDFSAVENERNQPKDKVKPIQSNTRRGRKGRKIMGVNDPNGRK